MKRALMVLLAVLALLTLPVQAAGSNTWTATASVDRSGAVRMTVRVTLRMNGPVSQVVIPLGEGAGNLNVNGVSLRVKKIDGVPSAVLESRDGFTGTQVFDLSYTLADCVTGENGWDLVLPLLAGGLVYSIDHMEFQVTLPGETACTPTFTSGYHGEDVDNYMTIQVSGNVITGSLDTALRDQETLVLTLETDPAVFPRTHEGGRLVTWSMAAALMCLLLAVAYWFFCLRWKPVRLVSQSQPPVGVGPGKMQSHLTTAPPDLALMVVAWAQAGYVTIHMNADQAVTLHKRMDMGNERGAYEQRLFNAIFGHGQLAETSGRSFQSLQARVGQSRLRLRGQFRRGSGNPLLLRLLGCAMSLFAGLAAGDAAMSSGAGRVLLLLLGAPACGGAAWLIQAAPRGIVSWNRVPAWRGLAAATAVLVGGLLTGQLLPALLICLCQVLIGLTVLFGGRRSETGRQTVQSILSFRQYLKTLDKKALNRIMARNPGYYYDMAAYALALGVDRPFAVRFGTLRLPRCPWLVTDGPQGNRAPEWYPLLRQVTRSIRGERSRPKARVRYEDEVL